VDAIHNRRTFLRVAAAAGAGWAAADLGAIETALAWAAQRATRGESEFKVLTAAQAATIDAMSSRILPSVDGRPGAHEAGAVDFVDRALATFNAGQTRLYRRGIADLDRRAARRRRGAAFASLAVPAQDDVLRLVQKTPFFLAVRFDTIVGTFGLPVWGGNRNYAGWHAIGLDHQPAFQAPFGFYDADVNRRR
jgi:hypothetical protein